MWTCGYNIEMKRIEASLYDTDTKKQHWLCTFPFYQIDNLSEANDKFESLKQVIKIYDKVIKIYA